MAAIAMVDHAGFEAVEAANAAQAIEVLESRMDIRIVFSDIDMPQGVDGVRLAAIIRDRWPQIEIILTSGFLESSRVELPTRGLFFSKPYDEQQVIAAMQKFAA
jgi:YesN/AraC family two-component response regulator